MREKIEAALREREAEQRIRILYACESGSRAWGFASPDSDYDVRFIYARERNAYLSITEPKDCIELPLNDLLDINGWDIRKALQLFLTSNPPIYEWLQSPVVYLDTGFASDLRQLMQSHFSLRAGCHHYSSMTRKTMETALAAGQVKLKKYFYALRPALAALWIVRNRSLPPMEFAALREMEPDGRWQQEVDLLINLKESAGEKTLIQPVAYLHKWLRTAMVEIAEKGAALAAVKRTPEAMDLLFRKWIS